MPAYFKSDLNVGGISALDLFTLNTTLGAVIEDQCVTTLNGLRGLWDPDGKYGAYQFERQSQTFPDVRLVASGQSPILGIELKGWALLSKEGEPSFRYKVTESVCAPQDLLAIVPWSFADVISGSPRIFEPIIVSAKLAARERNAYWARTKSLKSNPTIVSPPNAAPYPSPKSKIEDKPAVDEGNFGRLARSGFIDEEIRRLDDEVIRGVKAEYWRRFFAAFQETKARRELDAKFRQLEETIRNRDESPSTADQTLLDILEALQRLREI